MATREEHPQTEDYWGHVNPIGVRSCYDEGKRVAECLMMDYHRQNKVDVKIVRIFNTYGPRMAIDDGRVVSNFCVAALKGEDRWNFTAMAARHDRSHTWTISSKRLSA